MVEFIKGLVEVPLIGAGVIWFTLCMLVQINKKEK